MVMNKKRAQIVAIAMAIVFLIIHVFFLIVFKQYNVTPMVRLNIFSIIFYVAMCLLAAKGWFQVYTALSYMEIVIHMTLAVIYTGWGSSFQIIIIGINVLAFYGEYVGRSLKLRYARMLPFGITGMALYLYSYVYIQHHPPAYTMPQNVEFWLNIILATIVFVITLFILELFVIIVYSSDDHLEHQMSHDKLTGLPNRYYMANHLTTIQNKKGLTDYWIAIADIDDFKKINDTYGHNCGDYVLQTVAKIFSQNKDILCCRWGGEEFIFISKTKKFPDHAFEYLESLRKEIEAYEFEYNKTSFKVTATFGVSLFKAGLDTDSWISSADAKLYEGKQNGKNQVVL